MLPSKNHRSSRAPSAGPAGTPEGSVDISLRVRYAETDKMGVVYHANFFVWFEMGRTELLRAGDFSYRELEEDEDCHIMVAEATCVYRSPARYDDVVTVRTRIKELRSRVVVFEYAAMLADGKILATGETTHVVTDRRGKPRTLPDRYRSALQRWSVEEVPSGGTAPARQSQ